MSINKLKPGVDHAQFNKVIAVHREWVKKQLAAGVLVQAGKWGDNGDMIVVRAESREEADRVVHPVRDSCASSYENYSRYDGIAQHF
jgi:uncharacterized protein YciI